MRIFLLGLALSLTPGAASAACSCMCVEGQVRSVCGGSPGQLDLPVICQRICPISVLPPGAMPPRAETGDTSETLRDVPSDTRGADPRGAILPGTVQ